MGMKGGFHGDEWRGPRASQGVTRCWEGEQIAHCKGRPQTAFACAFEP